MTEIPSSEINENPMSPTLSPVAPTMVFPILDADPKADKAASTYNTTTHKLDVVKDVTAAAVVKVDEPEWIRLLPTLSDDPGKYPKTFSYNWPDDDDDPTFEGPFSLAIADMNIAEPYKLHLAYPIYSIYRDPVPKGATAAKSKIARDFIGDVLFGAKAKGLSRGVVFKNFHSEHLTNVRDNFRPLPLMFDTILGLRQHDYVKRPALRKALRCIEIHLGNSQRQVPASVDTQPRPRVRTHIYQPVNVYVMKAWKGVEEYHSGYLFTARSLDSIKGRSAPDQEPKSLGSSEDDASNIDGIVCQKRELKKFTDQIKDGLIRFHIFPIYTPSTHGDDRWMLLIYDNKETNRDKVTSKHKHVLGEHKGRYLHIIGYENDDKYAWTVDLAHAIQHTLQSFHIATEVNKITHIYPLTDKPHFYGEPISFAHTGPLIIHAITRALTLIEDVCQSNASFLRHARNILCRPDYTNALGNTDWSKRLRHYTRQLIQHSHPAHDLRAEGSPDMPDRFYTMLYDFLDMDTRPGPNAGKSKDHIRPVDVKLEMYHNADAYLIGQYKLPDDKPSAQIRRFRGIPLQKGSLVFLEGPDETNDEFTNILHGVQDLLQARKSEISPPEQSRAARALYDTRKSILALYVDKSHESWIIANNCVDSKWYVNGHKVSMSDFIGPLPSVTYIANHDLELVDGKSTFQWIFLQTYHIRQEHQEFAAFGKAPRSVLQNNFGRLWAPQDQDVSKRESSYTWHHHHRPSTKENLYLNHLWKLHTNDVVQCSNWRCYPHGVTPCKNTMNDIQHPHEDLFGSFAGSKFHDCKHDDCPGLAHKNEDDVFLPEGVVIYEPYIRNSRHLEIRAGRFMDEGGRIEGRSKLFHPPKTFMPIGFQSQDYWHGLDVRRKMAERGVNLLGDPQTGILFDLRGLSALRIKRQQLWNSLPERRQMQIWFEDMDQAKDNRNTNIGERPLQHTTKGLWDSLLGPNLYMNIKYTDAVDPFFETELGVDNVVVDSSTGRVDKVYNRRKYQRELYEKSAKFVQQDPADKPQTTEDMEPCNMIPTYGRMEDYETNTWDAGTETFSQGFQEKYNKHVGTWIQRQWYNIHVLEEIRHKVSSKGGGPHKGVLSETLHLWKQDLTHQWNSLMHAQKWTDAPKSGLVESNDDHNAEITAPPEPGIRNNMEEPLVPDGKSEPPAIKKAELKDVFKELGLKGHHRHHQNCVIVDFKANIKVLARKGQRHFVGCTREDVVNNDLINLHRDLPPGQSLDVLQKCIPRTSYYDENLLMEPNPIVTYLPMTVMTERVESGSHITSYHQQVQIAPDFNREKCKVTLVRDARTTILDKVSLKRQLDPVDVSSTKSPRKLPKLTRAALFQEDTLPKGNQEFA